MASVKRNTLGRAVIFAGMLATMLSPRMHGQAVPPFRVRGNAVEASRKALQDSLSRYRGVLSDSLRVAAPDLLPALDPAPPPVASGYGLLPRIIADPVQPPPTRLVLSTYTWGLTDTMIGRAIQHVDDVRSPLANPSKDHATYDRLVTTFNGIVAERRLIDAHVEHNWFWQTRIAADTAAFGPPARQIQRAMAGERVMIPPEALPAFDITMSGSAGSLTFVVPMVTDITDTAFVARFRSIIETQWSAPGYRVRLDIQRITPTQLNCAARPACLPPAVGTAIDVAAHVAKFPAGRAVLTTGGTQPYVLGGRALILGPRDLSARTLAHEFGHLLGFPDAYLRGYRDLGGEGFAILELVPDNTDIMASSGFGSVLPRHFHELESNIRAMTAMTAGLDALYKKNDPRKAAALFRETLRRVPTHYGATFQLAKALDAAGDSTAAERVWKAFLPMAVAAHDSTSITTARKRLRLPQG